MTPLQKSILNAVKRRPMTLRELQNNLQVDNSRLRTTVSAMVATGELSMRNGTYVPGFATYENAAAPQHDSLHARQAGRALRLCQPRRRRGRHLHPGPRAARRNAQR